MLWSEARIQTLREETHPLLVRAGYKRGSEYLLLGLRSLEKIKATGCDPKRCGITAIQTKSGFVAESASGDTTLVRGANYAELLDCAVSLPQAPAVPDPEGVFVPEEFYTPNVKTIAQISGFTGLPATSQMKTLVMVAGSKPIIALLRGDHQLSEMKLKTFLGANETRQATTEEIRAWFGADAGSLGPIGVRGIRIVCDEALRGRRNMIAGSNKNEYHLRNVTPERDFECEYADVRLVTESDQAITGGPLTFHGAALLDSPERILECVAEQNYDADGLTLPAAIAPFTVVVTPVHPDRLEVAREIYQRFLALGIDALLDDRDVRPGVKFKDADLIGFPYRINVGKKFSDGLVELVERNPHKSTDVPITEINIPR